MEDGYDYGNARIRAMKSRLLDAHAYEELLAARGIDDIVEGLAGTAYKADIEASLVKYGGMKCVAEALRLNVVHTLGKINTFFRGRPRQLVAILLGRWDIFNLLTILRGQARSVAADEILDTLVPAGELTEVELRQMAQQPSMRATADLMLTWYVPYAKPLAQALQAGGDLSDVETQLHQWRYREALAGLGDDANEALVKEMLQAEIDVVNVMMLLRLCGLRRRERPLRTRDGTPAAMSLLIPGGGLQRRTLEELSTTTDVESIVRGLSGTAYATILSNQAGMYRQSGDLTVLQRGLDEWLVRKGVAMWHRDPLSIAIPIGYIWAKMNEVANVRLIAQGKVLGWDREAIQRELIRL